MKIISFYSYKGGVGRSLLVANLAAYLCHYKERRVLLLDWDLEAPGLHYYFNRANLKNKGIIDLLHVFVTKMRSSPSRAVNKEELPSFEDEYIVEGIAAQGNGRVDLITAGLYDNEYTKKINDFNWEEFYKSFDGLTYIEFLKQKFKEWTKYDYIFIDSRTGVSDYWGVINIQIPDVNVFVAAPSNQNFEGVYEIASRIQLSPYVQSGNRRPIMLPILSRLDPLNNEKQGEWFARFRDKFRPLLKSFLEAIYRNETIQEKHIDKLIDSTLLNYKTDLSYGEQILFTSENKKIEYSTLEKKYEDIASIIEYVFGKNGKVPRFFDEETVASDPQKDENLSENFIIQTSGDNNQINITTLLGKSLEYQDLISRKQELETLLSLTPVEHLSKRVEISRKIEEQKKLLETFEQDVTQLAESFNKIKVNAERINTERLIKVKSLIETGKINEAREALETDASDLFEEQERLLDERKRLIKRSKDVEDLLKSNAEQFLILAQAIALKPTISDRYYESVRKYYESSIKSSPLPESLLGYALFLHHHNYLNEAEKYFERYLSTFGRKGESRAKGLIYLAVLHINTNNFKIARNELEEALKIYQLLAKKSPEKYMTEVAQTLSSLGLLQVQMNNFKEAETNLIESLQIYEALAEKTPQIYSSYVATIFNNLGTLHYNLNEFSQAEEEYLKALSIRRKLADENSSAYLSNVATTLTNIGAMYYERREFEKAEITYNEALSIQRDLANQNPYVHLSLMFGILNNLGNLYSDNNNFEKAVNCFSEALKTYRRLINSNSSDIVSTDYSSYIALTLNNLGTLYLNNNKLDEAENNFTQSYQIYRNLMKDNPHVYDNDLARVLNNLGSLYSENGSIERAENYYKDALKIYRRLAKISPQRYLLELSKILINLSIFYLKDFPDREKSLSTILEAEKIIQSLNDEISYKNNLIEVVQQIKNAWDVTRIHS